MEIIPIYLMDEFGLKFYYDRSLEDSTFYLKIYLENDMCHLNLCIKVCLIHI